MKLSLMGRTRCMIRTVRRVFAKRGLPMHEVVIGEDDNGQAWVGYWSPQGARLSWKGKFTTWVELVRILKQVSQDPKYQISAAKCPRWSIRFPTFLNGN